MAEFEKKDSGSGWKDRTTDYYNIRRLLAPTDENGDLITTEDNVYRIERVEGREIQAGNAFNAENMNDLERRIGNSVEDLTDEANKNVSVLNSTIMAAKAELNSTITSTKSELNNNIATANAETRNDLISTINTLDAKNVKLENAQTIAGTKTFSSIPLTTGGNPTSDNQLTRKAYVDAQVSTSVSTAVDNSLPEQKTYTILTTAWTEWSGGVGWRAATNIYSDSRCPILSIPSSAEQILYTRLKAVNISGQIFVDALDAKPTAAVIATITLIQTR